MEAYISKLVVFAVCWGFGGDMWMPQRIAFVSDVLPLLGSIAQPPTDGETTLLDYEVTEAPGAQRRLLELLYLVTSEFLVKRFGVPNAP